MADSASPVHRKGILVQSPRGSPPHGAVLLQEKEVLEMQRKLIGEWEPNSDVFILKHGPYITAALAGASGFYLNKIFRKTLKLRNLVRFPTYMAVAGFPFLTAAVSHSLIVDKIILMQNSCPLCLQMRAIGYQTGFGVLYPLILGPIVCLSFASRYFTVPVPMMKYEPKKTLHFILNIFKGKGSTIGSLLVIQALATYAITYMEMASMQKIYTKQLYK